MATAKEKLDKLFSRRRAVIFAFDHGFEHGPEDFRYSSTLKLVSKVLETEVDGIMLLPGLARVYRDLWEGKAELILKLTGKTNLRPEKDRYLQSSLGYVEEAIKYKAIAVAATVYYGSHYEDLMLKRWTSIRKSADRYGIPCIQLAYPRGPSIHDRYDFKVVAYGVRAAVESGADAIKTYYTGDSKSFRKVIEIAEGVPVLMAGGPRSKTPLDFIRQVRDCLDAGCSGVVVGRNVFQHENPKRTMSIVLEVVHKGKDPDNLVGSEG